MKPWNDMMNILTILLVSVVFIHHLSVLTCAFNATIVAYSFYR